jgi:hyperosmotically inducible protein
MAWVLMPAGYPNGSAPLPFGGVIPMRKVAPFLRAAVASVACVLLCSVVANAAERPDTWVTLKTKLALMTTEGIDTWDLNVDTVNGAVTLHGKVASDTAKQKAETVTQGIEGVKSVKNLLQVVPKPERKMVDKSDDAVRDAVKNAFDADPLVKDSGVSVASVNKGVVLLSGEAKSLEAHVKAVEIARAVPGVHRVSSEVTVKGT